MRYDRRMRTNTMHAMLIEEPDGPLVDREVPVPEPAPGEVLVEVGGCAVDRFDVAIRRGVRERATSLPHILGHEIAGTVAAIGENVSTFEPDSGSPRRCTWCAANAAGAFVAARRSVRTSGVTSA